MDYQEIIEQIANAARKLQLVIPDDEINQPFVDSTEPFVRIPVSAFCLKLAHEIWRETHNLVPFGGLLGAGMYEMQKHKECKDQPNEG